MLANYIAVLVGYLAITLGSACNYVAITGCASIDMSDPSSSDCPCLACDYPLTVSGDSTSCCTAADANCLTCDASSNCQTCVSNYFVDSGNVCALCSSQIPNCLTCSSVASGCTTCNAGYVINLSNACVHCSDQLTNCAACSSIAAGCTTCSGSYVLNAASHCVLCSDELSNCATCTSIMAGCTTCSGTYVVNPSNSCVQCGDELPNCATCASIMAGCASCVASYVFNAINQCVQCIDELPHCSTCASIVTGCTGCVTTYGLSSSSQCVLCGTYLPNCSECISISSGCTVCIANYQLNSTNQCAPCSTFISNCLTCLVSTACTGCAVNYMVNSAGQCSTCSSLISNCLTCSSPSICSQCISLYGLDSNHNCVLCNSIINNCSTCLSQSTGCTLCQIPFGLTSFKQCALCSTYLPGCYECFAVYSACIRCYAGSYWNASTLKCDRCSNYMSNCYLCQNNSVCQRCNDHFGFNASHGCELCSLNLVDCSFCSNTSYCAECLSYLGFDVNRVCIPCYNWMPNCKDCYSRIDQCWTCNVSGLGVNQSSVPDTCVPCILTLADCLECTVNTYCTKCLNNSYTIIWFGYNNQTCISCGIFLEGCETCSSKTVCTACISTHMYLLNTTSKTCVSCDSYLSNCTTCSTTTYCLKCYDHRYALTPAGVDAQACYSCLVLMVGCLYCQTNSLCTLCIRGQLMSSGRGCSSVSGCVSINPSAPIDNNCLSCDPISFIEMPQNGHCICAFGRIVGDQCTTVIGCIGVKVKNKNVLCISCDNSKKFMLVGHTCDCYPYYELSGESCVQICGDGYLISLPCDDGNRNSGDGCSSKCEIEHSYVCVSDNKNNPASKCQYKGKVQLALDSVTKSIGPNVVEVAFDILPYDQKLLQMDLMSCVTFNAEGCTVKSISIEGHQLHVQLGYIKDITNEKSDINIHFDPEYVYSPDFSMTFQMIESNGLPLTYNSNVAVNKTIILMVRILSLMALGVFLLGSIAFKMIGLETLFTIQIIWFVQASSKFYKSLFANFQSLNYAYGQLSTFFFGSEIITTSKFSNLGFRQNMNDNYLLFIAVNVGLFIAYAGFFIYSSYQKSKLTSLIQKKQMLTTGKFKKLTNQKNEKINKAKKVMNIIYNWALFPILIGFQFHFMHTISVFQINAANQTVTYSQFFLLTFTLVLTSTAFFRQIVIRDEQYEKRMLNRPQKNPYIPFFLLCSFLYFFMLSFLIQANNHIIYFAGIALSLLQIAFIIFFKPYKSRFDNASLIINQAAIVFNIAWILIKDLPSYTYSLQALFVYAFLGLAYAVVALGLIRSIYALKRICFSAQPNLIEQITPKPLFNQPKEAQVTKKKLIIDTFMSNEVKDMIRLRSSMNSSSKQNSFAQPAKLTERHGNRNRFKQRLIA